MRLWVYRTFCVGCLALIALTLIAYGLGYESLGEFLWGPKP